MCCMLRLVGKGGSGRSGGGPGQGGGWLGLELVILKDYFVSCQYLLRIMHMSISLGYLQQTERSVTTCSVFFIRHDLR